MQTPDITPVQKLVAAAIGLVAAVLPLLTAFGVNLSTEQITAIGGVASGLGGLFVLADAVIRHGRSKVADTQLSIDYAEYVRQQQIAAELPVDANEKVAGDQPAAA